VFRAALGGIGAMGVVVEVRLKLVPAFLVKRVTTYVKRDQVEAGIDPLGFFSFFSSHSLNIPKLKFKLKINVFKMPPKK
jgi:FAD/FMN-containing dehydrogenase